MTINCWECWKCLLTIFPIQLSSTDLVETLRKALKSKKPVGFRDIDMDDLNIYKVLIPLNEDDESLQEAMNRFTISSLGKALHNAQQLSDVFTSLQDDHLHLVIDPVGLPVSVECWIRGTDSESSFGFRISTRAKIYDLKQAACRTLDDVSIDHLRLYLIPTDGLDETLGTLGSGRFLEGSECLRDVFSDVPLFQAPRIVIETEIWEPSYSMCRYSGGGDPIMEARAAFLAYDTKEKPSSASVQSAFRARQSDSRRRIPCGFPHGYEESVTTTLLHPAFGDFIDDCQTIGVTADDIRLVNRLSEAMSSLYDTEVWWISAVNRVFQDHNINFTFFETESTGYMTGADEDGPCYVIAQYKNENGSMSVEPYFQTIGCYLESTRDSALEFIRSPLPCFLLSICGPYIAFAGATWNLRPVVQVLSTPITLCFHSTDTHNRLIATRHMAAFRKATQTLKEYYEHLRETPVPTSSPALIPRHMFPYPTSYSCGETLRHFHYLEQPCDEKRVFFGTEVESNVDICIKFVQSYSPEAHEHLAHLQCAPALRGFQKIAGGWFMVVMERLHGYESLRERLPALPSSVFDDMFEKLASLHSAKYVHGDIRDANIMVSKDGSNTFMIIDFDWAGKAGEVRYPPYVNYIDIPRPGDVRDGNKILEEHDNWMLDRIRRFRSEC